MGVKREEIRDTSQLSLKRLNDNIKYLWYQAFKSVTFGDLSADVQTTINSKVGKIYTGVSTGLANGSHTISLPTEFKNTNFKVLIGVTQVLPTGTTTTIKSFSCKLNNTDTVNGQFTVVVDGKSSDNTNVSIDISYAAIS